MQSNGADADEMLIDMDVQEGGFALKDIDLGWITKKINTIVLPSATEQETS